MKKPKFDILKVYYERGMLIRQFAKRERMNLQDALDEVILAGLKVKRLLPPVQDGDTEPQSQR